MRLGRALLVILAATLAPRGVAAQEEEPRGRPEISEIKVTGNAAFPTDSLKRSIVNRETECRARVLEPFCAFRLDFADSRHYFNADEFPRDAVRLRLYYWQRGYREARVDTARSVDAPDRIELTFAITEGPPVLVDSIAVLLTDSVADGDRLRRDLPLEQGDPLSMIALQATRDTLEGRLHDAGYAHALVLLSTELPFGSHGAEVTFDVDPGGLARFGPIEIAGNNELSDEVIRRMLGFREGQVYGARRLLDAQRNLFGLELVQYARVDTLPTAERDTIIPVRVEITEGFEYRVRGGAGWSTAECLSTEARWTARNFLGGARRLQVRGRLSNVLAEKLQTPFCADAGVDAYGKLNWLGSVDFSQPWIFSPRNSLTFGVFGERTSYKDLFVRTSGGANIALIRSLGRATPLSFSYRPQLTKLDAAEVFFCSSFLACEPSDIENLQSANWLSPLGANVSTDQTDNLLNPRSGYRAVLDFEHAAGWTGSDYAYDRVLGEASGYAGLGAGVVVAARLRGGWVMPGRFAGLQGAEKDVVHPQKRFFVGGSNSVRGYAQNRLGPKVLTVDERRLLLPDTVGGAPVCTIGEVVALSCDASRLPSNAFNPQPTGGTRMLEGSFEARFPIGRAEFEGVTFLDFGQVWAESTTPGFGDLSWTPGIGLRYYSVIGPIRLDLGYRPTSGESLPVITSQVRACVPNDDDPTCTAVSDGIGFTSVGRLAVLDRPVPFERGFDWKQRLQLHFSIGQAF